MPVSKDKKVATHFVEVVEIIIGKTIGTGNKLRPISIVKSSNLNSSGSHESATTRKQWCGQRTNRRPPVYLSFERERLPHQLLLRLPPLIQHFDKRRHAVFVVLVNLCKKRNLIAGPIQHVNVDSCRFPALLSTVRAVDRGPSPVTIRSRPHLTSIPTQSADDCTNLFQRQRRV